MTASDAGVSRHYAIPDLGDRILAALQAAGKDPDALTAEDLAPVDAFHIRGRAATAELAEWAGLEASDRVLDVGCGLGGTGRYLAGQAGCSVMGVDLTEDYCRVAAMLSARVGLDDRTEFRAASALDLPFEDGSFDVAWTEHVQMNVADKASFYGEMARVLGAGGRLAFHDVFAAAGGELHYPLPWAAEPSISHLISAAEAEAILAGLGFRPLRWEDKTAESEAFFRSVLDRVRAEGWMPLGLHLLMGDDAAHKFANVLRNLEEGRVQVVQAVLQRGDPAPDGAAA